MTRFQFRLQTVLEHRQRKETLAHSSYGQAQSQLTTALKMLAELEDIQSAIITELSERRTSGQFDPNESRMYHEYLKTIKQCLVDQEAYVADLSSTAEALRLNLVGASQDRQVLDQMKQKAKSVHQMETLKAEQNASDDLASSRRQFTHVQVGHE